VARDTGRGVFIYFPYPLLQGKINTVEK